MKTGIQSSGSTDQDRALLLTGRREKGLKRILNLGLKRRWFSVRWKGELRELEVPKQELRAQDGSLDTTPGSVLLGALVTGGQNARGASQMGDDLV